jgi:hypothetical protein
MTDRYFVERLAIDGDDTLPGLMEGRGEGDEGAAEGTGIKQTQKPRERVVAGAAS